MELNLQRDVHDSAIKTPKIFLLVGHKAPPVGSGGSNVQYIGRRKDASIQSQGPSNCAARFSSSLSNIIILILEEFFLIYHSKMPLEKITYNKVYQKSPSADESVTAHAKRLEKRGVHEAQVRSTPE